MRVSGHKRFVEEERERETDRQTETMNMCASLSASQTVCDQYIESSPQKTKSIVRFLLEICHLEKFHEGGI